MWYKDLTIHYFGGRDDIPRLAIGWLESTKYFQTGEAPKAVYVKLCEIREKPWIDYVSCGYHECDFCGKKKGSLNITIPHQGKLYHYPELITHYIEEHFYFPPEQFCEAVLACPPMDSMDYYKKMIENGGEKLLSYFHETWEESKKL
jgi:hypothetical protein